jgi:hypothetical protein
MLLRKVRLIILLLAGSAVLTACAAPGAASPTLDVAAVETRIAANIFNALTETMQAEATTQTPEPSATNTPELPSETPTITLTASQTPTNTPEPSPTAPPIPCNAAQLVSDVTVTDGALFEAGAKFTKTWRINNVGSCSWGSGYVIRFTQGTNLATKNSYPLPASVPPNGTVDVSIEMTAPKKVGTYRSSWNLVSGNGITFGVGTNAATAVYAQIQVQVLANANYEYDFAANACAASWRSAEGALPCPGTSSNTKGFVILLDGAKLENRTEDELLLWVHPNHDSGGFIRGTFPAIKISNGDHFVAWIGCLAENKNCNVRFRLDYINPAGNTVSLGKWAEVQDGSIHELDIDLSALAGKKVQFILTMEMRNENYNHANGFWFQPSIRN